LHSYACLAALSGCICCKSHAGEVHVTFTAFPLSFPCDAHICLHSCGIFNTLLCHRKLQILRAKPVSPYTSFIKMPLKWQPSSLFQIH
ncbi:hypothetical protein L9F63_018019, partial [Diploptera punctata]